MSRCSAGPIGVGGSRPGGAGWGAVGKDLGNGAGSLGMPAWRAAVWRCPTPTPLSRILGYSCRGYRLQRETSPHVPSTARIRADTCSRRPRSPRLLRLGMFGSPTQTMAADPLHLHGDKAPCAVAGRHAARHLCSSPSSTLHSPSSASRVF